MPYGERQRIGKRGDTRDRKSFRFYVLGVREIFNLNCFSRDCGVWDHAKFFEVKSFDQVLDVALLESHEPGKVFGIHL